MNYYYDPSNPVALVTGSGMTANALSAATDAGCTGPIVSAKLAETISPSLLNTPSDISFRPFPNPFSNELTISYKLPAICKTAIIKIYEAASGKEIFSGTLSNEADQLVLDRINVAEGMYICSIIADNGTSKQFKLVNIK